MSDQAKEALDLAKIHLLGIKDNVFLTTVLFSLDIFWDDMTDHPPDSPKTLYVDGISIGIHKEFFMSLSPKLRVSALAHEAWHVCFKHITRRGDRHPKGWNWAGDFIINLMLKNAGFEIGTGWLLDDQFEGWSTDEVYEKIMKKAKESLKGLGKPQDGKGLDAYFKTPAGGLGDDIKEQEEEAGSNPDQKTDLERKIDNIITKAAVQAKMSGDKSIGNLPGEIGRYLEELANPVVPWQTVMMNDLTTYNKDDYTFRIPNKKFLGNADDNDDDLVVMPSLWSEALGKFASICDLSMSVGDDELAEFHAENHSIKELLNPESFTICSFDTKFYEVATFSQEEELIMNELPGGGGTSIGPVIDWLNDNNPDIAVIFTDGEFYWPEQKYDGKLIWLIYGNPHFEAPFGRVIHYR